MCLVIVIEYNTSLISNFAPGSVISFRSFCSFSMACLSTLARWFTLREEEREGRKRGREGRGGREGGKEEEGAREEGEEGRGEVVTMSKYSEQVCTSPSPVHNMSVPTGPSPRAWLGWCSARNSIETIIMCYEHHRTHLQHVYSHYGLVLDQFQPDLHPALYSEQ